jgi:hypothetical protein
VRSIPGSSSPSVALGEGFPECFLLFPECFRHSGKQAAAVVHGYLIFSLGNCLMKLASLSLRLS